LKAGLRTVFLGKVKSPMQPRRSYREVFEIPG
jgi:hypothetical protein